MSVEQLISQISEGSEDAKVTLESILMSKIAYKLDELKMNVMSEAFPSSSKDDDEDDDDADDSDDEKDKSIIGSGKKDEVEIKESVTSPHNLNNYDVMNRLHAAGHPIKIDAEDDNSRNMRVHWKNYAKEFGLKTREQVAAHVDQADNNSDPYDGGMGGEDKNGKATGNHNEIERIHIQHLGGHE